MTGRQLQLKSSQQQALKSIHSTYRLRYSEVFFKSLGLLLPSTHFRFEVDELSSHGSPRTAVQPRQDTSYTHTLTPAAA